MSTDPASAGPTARQLALARCVLETERHVAGGGWDGPVRVFALVPTLEVLAAGPQLAAELGPEAVAAAQADPEHLTAVEQEGLPEATSLEELLAQLAWPQAVAGAALSVERSVLPPAVEKDVPADETAAAAFLLDHPDREDVRLVAGVLRTGESWCALRARAHDDDDRVAGGSDLAPGLVQAVAATLDVES